MQYAVYLRTPIQEMLKLIELLKIWICAIAKQMRQVPSQANPMVRNVNEAHKNDHKPLRSHMTPPVYLVRLGLPTFEGIKSRPLVNILKEHTYIKNLLCF